MYTIKEVVELMDLPASTIRYYDKQGLLPFIERSDSGYRLFSEDDIALLKIIECLKLTNMPIKEIKEFIHWIQMGDASLQQRYNMFLERRNAVEEQIRTLEKTLEVIDYKCWYYKTSLEAGTEDIHKKEIIHE